MVIFGKPVPKLGLKNNLVYFLNTNHIFQTYPLSDVWTFWLDIEALLIYNLYELHRGLRKTVMYLSNNYSLETCVCVCVVYHRNEFTPSYFVNI